MARPGIELLVVAAFAVLLGTIYVGGLETQEQVDEWSIEFVDGSMFISDAGSSHGGFEYTASYYANLTPVEPSQILSGDQVVLDLALEIGLGDALEKHSYSFQIVYNPLTNTVCLKDSDITIALAYVGSDTVWDHEWDGYFIASWGGYAPADEIRGVIDPTWFGLPEHYYIELRLKLDITHIVP